MDLDQLIPHLPRDDFEMGASRDWLGAHYSEFRGLVNRGQPDSDQRHHFEQGYDRKVRSKRGVGRVCPYEMGSREEALFLAGWHRRLIDDKKSSIFF